MTKSKSSEEVLSSAFLKEGQNQSLSRSFRKESDTTVKIRLNLQISAKTRKVP